MRIYLFIVSRVTYNCTMFQMKQSAVVFLTNEPLYITYILWNTGSHRSQGQLDDNAILLI